MLHYEHMSRSAGEYCITEFEVKEVESLPGRAGCARGPGVDETSGFCDIQSARNGSAAGIENERQRHHPLQLGLESRDRPGEASPSRYA